MHATFAGIALTGSTIYESLSRWTAPTRAQVDVVQGCRVAHVTPIPMGNRATPVTLYFGRDGGTYFQAQMAKARLAATLPDQGTLVLSQESGGLIIYPDACFESVEVVEVKGVRYEVQLAFQTGAPPAVSESAPPEVGATWDTWDEANWEDLDRLWDEEQVTA